jgi:hypothetical protein
MAVPANPSLQDVVNEFGGPGDLYSYTRGGPYVPNVAQNANIATNPGLLELLQFVGAVRYVAVTGSFSPGSFAGGAQGVPASGNVTTNYVAAYGANGNGGYRYTWSIASVSNGGVPTISDSNAQSVYLSRVVAASVGTISGTAACVISDGTSSTTVYVPYSLSYSQNK